MTKSQREYWWLYLLQGILITILGVGILTWPGLTLATMFMFIAIFFLIDGIIRAISGLVGIGRKKGWFWGLVGGIIEALAGATALIYPGLTTIGIVFTIGFVFIIKGIVEIAGSGGMENSPRGLSIFVGVLDIIIGLYLAFNPIYGGALYFWLLGLYAIIAGIVTVVKSFQLHSERPA